MTDRFAAGANAWSLCDFAGHGIGSCPVGQGVAVVSDLGIHGGGLGSVFLFASFRRAVRLVGRAALVHLPQLPRLR